MADRVGADRCCPACRLLGDGLRCTACGEGTCLPDEVPAAHISPASVLDVERPLSSGRLLAGSAWGGGIIAIGGVILVHTGSVRSPGLGQLLWIAATVASLILFALYRDRGRGQLRPISAPVAGSAPSAVGRARWAREPLAGGGLVRAFIARNDEGLFLRMIDHVDFFLDGADASCLVTGTIHVAGSGTPASAEVFGEWAAMLPAVRIEAHALREGDEVEAIGEAKEEPISDGYRDRTVRVLRGTAERPVILRRA